MWRRCGSSGEAVTPLRSPSEVWQQPGEAGCSNRMGNRMTKKRTTRLPPGYQVKTIFLEGGHEYIQLRRGPPPRPCAAARNRAR
jgi:hypothetical protein